MECSDIVLPTARLLERPNYVPKQDGTVVDQEMVAGRGEGAFPLSSITDCVSPFHELTSHSF